MTMEYYLKNKKKINYKITIKKSIIYLKFYIKKYYKIKINKKY